MIKYFSKRYQNLVDKWESYKNAINPRLFRPTRVYFNAIEIENVMGIDVREQEVIIEGHGMPELYVADLGEVEILTPDYISRFFKAQVIKVEYQTWIEKYEIRFYLL